MVLTNQQHRAFECLRKSQPLTARTLADLMGLGDQHALILLRALLDAGLAVRDKSDGPWEPYEYLVSKAALTTKIESMARRPIAILPPRAGRQIR